MHAQKEILMLAQEDCVKLLQRVLPPQIDGHEKNECACCHQ